MDARYVPVVVQRGGGVSSLTFTTKVVSIGVSNWRMGSQVCFLKPKDAGPLHELLARAEEKAGGYVTIRLDLPRRPRSTGYRSQSAHFHGHVQSICEESGNDMEDVKLYLKRRAVRRGYPLQKTKDGDIRVSLADGEPLPQSEADASVEESNMLIEEAHQLAAELKVTLVEYED